MTFRGEVRHGVVVLEGKPFLEDGTIVEVKPLRAPSAKSARGSAAAVLRAAGGWSNSQNEMDDALKYLDQLKRDEVEQELGKLKKAGPLT